MKVLMMSLFSATLAITSCAATSPDASPEDVFAEQNNVQQMTSRRLATVLDGNTLIWDDGSAVYYSGSEIRTPNSDGTVTVGTIDFSNNMHCRTWNGGGEKCSSVYEDDDVNLNFFVEGQPDSSGGRGRITIGKPEGL